MDSITILERLDRLPDGEQRTQYLDLIGYAADLLAGKRHWPARNHP